jgi:outer membrane protein assembly factor BamB
MSKCWNCLVTIFLLCAFPASASDWPNYRGPNHDGISFDRITTDWSGSVTNPVWLVLLSNSFSSFTISGGRVYTQINPRIGTYDDSDHDSFTNREACVALNATDGARLWLTMVEDNAPHTQDTGVRSKNGPRSTPVVYGDSIFVLTSYMKLYRLNATNGAVIWQKDLLAEYGGVLLHNEAAASPLIEDGLIFVSTCAGAPSYGAAGVSNLMAFSTADGSLVWRTQDDNMTHSTPIIASIHGVRQVIFPARSGLVSLEPTTGALLWKAPYPFTLGTLSDFCASPVVAGDIVFVTASRGQLYGSGARRVAYTNNTWSTTLLWSKVGSRPANDTVASLWMTPVVVDSFLYGQFGNAATGAGGENDTGTLKCVDLLTGTIMWSTNNFGRGGTLLVNSNLLIITERGDLVLARPATNAYTELARFPAIPDYDPTTSATNVCWNTPAVADGKVYIRSTQFGAMYDLSSPALKLDVPQIAPANTLNLAVRTVTGMPVNANRLTSMEVRAATNLALSPEAWPKLTNQLVLSNGVVIVTNVDGALPNRYFIVTEPK